MTSLDILMCLSFMRFNAKLHENISILNDMLLFLELVLYEN